MNDIEILEVMNLIDEGYEIIKESAQDAGINPAVFAHVLLGWVIHDCYVWAPSFEAADKLIDEAVTQAKELGKECANENNEE